MWILMISLRLICNEEENDGDNDDVNQILNNNCCIMYFTDRTKTKIIKS